MTGASKILTVSYGTFSCTLEGFDDPFNTMRAIAEYFRDLAADDRYFGAEPPTPDAAMLHRIAERELQRRVEAKVGDNGVVLRAEDAPMPRVTMPGTQAAPIQAAPIQAAPAQTATVQAVTVQVAPVRPPMAAPSVAPSVASVADAASATESAAARLSRLRAAQAQILAPTPAPSLGDISSRFADVEAYAEDQDAETSFQPAAPVPQPQPVHPEPAVVVSEPAVNLIEEIAQPVAAVVDAIAAPVATAEPEAPEAEGFAEDMALDAQSDADLIASLNQSFEADEPADMAAADTTAADLIAAEEPVSSSLLETLAGLIGQDDQLAEDMANAAEEAAFAAPDFAESDDILPEDAADPADLAQFGAEFEDIDPADFDDLAALDGLSPAEVASAAETPDETAEAAAKPLAEVHASPEAPVVAEKIQRARARVIKIRRLDKKSPGEGAAQTDAAALTPEAEADLQNALAALEAEIAPAAAPAVLPDADLTPATTTPVQTIEKARESKLAAADDAAVDRLLAQTNSQLEVPETKRRRSAIAHLKAAVLATVADRKNNPRAQAQVAEVKMDPYRQDLSQAVRPTGSQANGERPAPLVLVSAQRIDRLRDTVADANRPVPQIVASAAPVVQTSPSVPVRPRRVSSGGLAQAVSTDIEEDEDSEPTRDANSNIFADGTKQSFADFAESLGATTLGELIEAAGAYCTLVLDRPSFTRPLLFQQISSVPEHADLNREDGLRGFGKLLRDGRIQKTVRGQFALSETSPILTEAKRIAG